ncbi:hypothetical protein BYT27DRAFT_7258786 [Phlegmacium glaucopus]|nr:hypothetical protein BYT27DRAFT_7258786 [Phlegmacium glaucopus]
MESEVSEDARGMVAFWRDMAADGGGIGSMAVGTVHVFILAAEPRQKGLFEPYFWTRSTHVHTPYTSLIPLLFPDPLPTLSTGPSWYAAVWRVMLQKCSTCIVSTLNYNKRPAERFIALMRTMATLQSGVFEPESSSRPSSHVSRPPSSVVDHGSEKTLGRNPSIRVKPMSLLSRQNLVTSESSPDPPLRIVVQAGTLNNLVNVLVHGLENISVSVANDNGEMSLREGMKCEIVIDRAEFARVWWNVFQSFVSPLMFFEIIAFCCLLEHSSLMASQHLCKIYSTAQPAGSSPPASDHLLIARTRNEVLVAIQE